jgi:hypothetical protein
VRSYFFEKPIQRKYGVRSEDRAVDCHFAMECPSVIIYFLYTLKALTNKSFEGEKQSWCANNFSYT